MLFASRKSPVAVTDIQNSRFQSHPNPDNSWTTYLGVLLGTDRLLSLMQLVGMKTPLRETGEKIVR